MNFKQRKEELEEEIERLETCEEQLAHDFHWKTATAIENEEAKLSQLKECEEMVRKAIDNVEEWEDQTITGFKEELKKELGLDK